LIGPFYVWIGHAGIIPRVKRELPGEIGGSLETPSFFRDPFIEGLG
jgi:hypothetical protein